MSQVTYEALGIGKLQSEGKYTGEMLFLYIGESF